MAQMVRWVLAGPFILYSRPVALPVRTPLRGLLLVPLNLEGQPLLDQNNGAALTLGGLSSFDQSSGREKDV